MRALFLAAAAALTAACGYVSFGRTVSDEELLLRDSVRGYYDEAAVAFAAGNADALVLLFDASIAKPMNREQILAWGRDFFAKHGPGRFRVEKLEFERLGHQSAVVVLTYRVETLDGKGNFGGVERNYLAKRGKRWLITSWEKISD